MTIATKRIPEPDDIENAVTHWQFTGQFTCAMQGDEQVPHFRRKNSAEAWQCLECYVAERDRIPTPAKSEPPSGIRLVEAREDSEKRVDLWSLSTPCAEGGVRTRALFGIYEDAVRAGNRAVQRCTVEYGQGVTLHDTNWIAGLKSRVEELERYAVRHLQYEIEKARQQP